MGVLIKNEFYKLKREWFMVFLLLLSLLPIITGGAGAVFNNSTKSLADLFFFMNNQFSMFFYQFQGFANASDLIQADIAKSIKI